MKTFFQILVNVTIRIAMGIAVILCANAFLSEKEMLISVGINAISIGVSGMLGLPGVAMLYAIVAIGIL